MRALYNFLSSIYKCIYSSLVCFPDLIVILFPSNALQAIYFLEFISSVSLAIIKAQIINFKM